MILGSHSTRIYDQRKCLATNFLATNGTDYTNIYILIRVISAISGNHLF
jgi:hypothetical protein